MGNNRGIKNKVNTKFLQDLDLVGSLHKEEGLIGGDADLLSLPLKWVHESWREWRKGKVKSSG
jgi:hypothetical protein